ncbi:AraC family transcriptional regulator [Paenibacillus sp. JTLBN-2024]
MPNLWAICGRRSYRSSTIKNLFFRPCCSTPSTSLLPSVPALHGSYREEAWHHQADAAWDENSLFRQAKLFIADNLSEELTLPRVAGHLHISPRHLTRLFQQHTNQTFVHYIQERRVQVGRANAL